MEGEGKYHPCDSLGLPPTHRNLEVVGVWNASLVSLIAGQPSATLLLDEIYARPGINIWFGSHLDFDCI